ncbi:GlxA family transcriptional regulator [Nonomuraea aurantiaca]|uniref:GlxA family transcriptional regulator n=1 Tax=Nonomuraea aurantiaca TaxID=2878562 RepID=UPI001CD9DF88|nr:helix-turn-helix domain-containing protein [Nonomuraea aurantiaca]MCA2226351.1 helix-turn-helix domain-containing protein [Nonomuraea aurantiaca]
MITVAVLAYDDAPTFELSIPQAVFGAAELADRCEVVLVSGEPGELRTEHGWRLPTRSLPELTSADLLVVAGWRDPAEDVPASMVEAVRDAAHAGATVVALCTGAFVVAAAGLLDGEPATTHWRHAPAFARRFPHVHLDPAVLYVDRDAIATSAGTAAGIDLCLHLVRARFGATVANAIARHLVVPAHREGGQAQYLPQAVQSVEGDDPIRASMKWMTGRLDQQITVADQAARCHLSARQYVRRFADVAGISPYQWLLHQRIARACELLENTDDSIDQIATACGFADPTGLRAQFRRRVGATPTAYRATFRTRGNNLPANAVSS